MGAVSAPLERVALSDFRLLVRLSRQLSLVAYQLGEIRITEARLERGQYVLGAGSKGLGDRLQEALKMELKIKKPHK